MSRNFEDIADELIEIESDPEGLDELESSSLTWDDEVVREAHRIVSIRALRAASREISSRWAA